MLNVRLSSDKAVFSLSAVPFLGLCSDFTQMQEGYVTLAPKLGYREKVLEAIQNAIHNDYLSSSMAAKLRGMLNALDLGLMGKSLRGALIALTARQYWEKSTQIHTSLSEAFWHIKH
eukprot:10895775-Karenia_brevis.AAC.1